MTMQVGALSPCHVKQLWLCGLLTAVCVAGCQVERPPVTYPPGTLPVRLEPSTSHRTCLVACAAMAANYLLGERRFTESSIREELRLSGRDETGIDDLKAYLAEKGLHLVSLAGRIDGKPPTALRYWLAERGYPVICIINREGANPAFNHAVVVTGIQAKSGESPTDIITCLDPSLPQAVQNVSAAEFDILWERGQHAMMIVVAPPVESRPALSGSKE